METFNKILEWLKSLPLIGRIFSVVAIILVLVAMVFFSSCGMTKAVVHNGANGTTTEIKITTNNPTSVTASPNVELKPNLNQD